MNRSASNRDILHVLQLAFAVMTSAFLGAMSLRLNRVSDDSASCRLPRPAPIYVVDVKYLSTDPKQGVVWRR